MLDNEPNFKSNAYTPHRSERVFGVEQRPFPNSDVEAAMSSPEPSMHASLSRLGDVHASITKTRSKRAVAAQAQEGDDAQTEAADAVGGAEAELAGKLRGVFVSYMREQFGDRDLSDDQVLEHMTAFPNLNDNALMRRLAGAAGLYGSKEGEDDVAPALKKALVEQLLLALTGDVDWKAELATPTTGVANGVTTDGEVLHGANEMTIAEAAAAVKERVGSILAGKLGGGAALMADQLAPVLINDPTLYLPEPSDAILYGSLEWARLWIGIEYAEGTGLDPAQLSVDQLLALGRAATATGPADDGETAQAEGDGGSTADDAATYRTTKLLALIARAKGEFDGQEITEQNREEVEQILPKVAEDVFSEDFAFASALDDISQEMPTRRELAATILREHGLDPDQPVKYPVPSAHGLAWAEGTLAESYFENGYLPGHNELRDPSEVFEERFAAYKSEFSEGMETILGRLLDNYAKHNNLDLSGATITFFQPEAHAYIRRGRLSESFVETSNSVLIVEIAVPESGSRYGFLSLADIGKGLQNIPADTSVDDWIFSNSSTIYTAEQIRKYMSFLNTSGSSMTENRVVKKEIFSGAGTEIRGKIREYYGVQIAQCHDHALGETRREGITNFLLDLIPFRSMIVAIQKGDLGAAILSGILDIASFIPFVGEGFKALQIGFNAATTGLSTMLRTALRQGLNKGLSLGLRTTTSFGREFGGQFFKFAATGLENALPFPTPGFASHITVGGAKSTARVIDSLRATDSELAGLLEQASRRSSLIDAADDGGQRLARGVNVTKDANGIERVELADLAPSTRNNEINVGEVQLAVGHNEDGQLRFFREHESAEGSFYTQADPRTGESYGPRMTLNRAGWLISNGARIARLGNAIREAAPESGESSPTTMIEYGRPSSGWSDERAVSDGYDAFADTASSWARKTADGYSSLNEAGRQAVLGYVRDKGRLTFTFWIHDAKADLHKTVHVETDAKPESKESLEAYFSRVAKEAGAKAEEQLRRQHGDAIRLDYIGVGAALPLASHVERAHTPLSHHLQAHLDLGSAPLAIEHNRVWEDPSNDGAVKAHATSLAGKILQHYEFNDTRLKRDILDKIREAEGITFSGWLADTSARDSNHSFEMHVDLASSQFDGTLGDYIRKSAEVFAEAFRKHIEDSQDDDTVNIRHIAMKAELANVRVKDEFEDFPPEDLIAFGISRPAGGADKSHVLGGSTGAKTKRRREVDHAPSAAGLDTLLDGVPLSRIEVSRQTSGYVAKSAREVAASWSRKVLQIYNGFNDSVRNIILNRIRAEGGIKFSVWRRYSLIGNCENDILQPSKRKFIGESFANYVNNTAKYVEEYLTSLGSSSDRGAFNYLAIGAELPLPTQLERALIPEGHAVDVVPNFGAPPLVIEHNKRWGGTKDAKDYGTIGRHGDELASKILQRFTFNDEGLEKKILTAIRRRGGIKFQGWLSDLDMLNNDYSFEKVIDPASGEYDGTLKDYVRRAAHAFAEAFERNIRPQEYEDIEIEFIQMAAELADIRLKDGDPFCPTALFPSSDQGARSMRATFAALTRELRATGGDVGKSDKLFEAARSSLKARSVVLGELPLEEAQAVLEAEGKRLLKTYYNYAANNIETQQELLLLRRSHPAEYAAEELGEWLGIAKEHRHKLVDERSVWRLHKSVGPLGSSGPILPPVEERRPQITSWIDLLERDDLRARLAQRMNKSMREALVGDLRKLVEPGKEAQFAENITRLFTVDIFGDSNNDELPRNIEDIQQSYESYYGRYVEKSAITFRKLEAEKIVLRSGRDALIAKANPNAVEDLVAHLGQQSADKLKTAVANFQNLLEDRRDEDQLHNLEHLKQKRLELAKLVSSKIPVLGDVIDLGIDAALGDWTNVGHDALRTAAFAAMFLPAAGPELGAVLFAADASWGEGESITSYLEAKQRGDEAGAQAAMAGMIGNGVGLMMSGIPLLRGSFAGSVGEAIILEDIEGAQESFELQEMGAVSENGEGAASTGADAAGAFKVTNIPKTLLDLHEKIPTYNEVKPDIKSITKFTQNRSKYSDLYNGYTRGVCAAWVSVWLQKRLGIEGFSEKILANGINGNRNFANFLANLQEEYSNNASRLSLLARRRMRANKVLSGTGQRAISEIVDAAVQGHNHIYLSIRGKGRGHALGLALGKSPRFFDPNWGVFKFKSKEELSTWVKEYINEHYKNIKRVTAISVEKTPKWSEEIRSQVASQSA
ncbi:YopT-type cysteine protease domain-containing protein [Chelativorans salis]|uniref:YopT-type cysteine protease domain-containing protein n=1 Tax=Chelativorans salis TaxID=2978478 RepID=A0ABT2LH61_9HYPH|nr:YopT-type cysteine protease domain-containing protein [Chelativorans sp. EGI FJ00035]MCT7373763.1 YopT-type cysteine protease domain-containing protein [Chelativorans sp. EGI FJ00035]